MCDKENDSKLHTVFFHHSGNSIAVSAYEMQGFSCDNVSASPSSQGHSAILPGFCESAWKNTHAVIKKRKKTKPKNTPPENTPTPQPPVLTGCSWPWISQNMPQLHRWIEMWS